MMAGGLSSVLNGLAGKVAIVTRGAGGLGSPSARRPSQEGCREEDIAEYLGEATRAFGRIDLRHLHAGIPGPVGGFPDLEADEFDRGRPLGIRVNAVAPGIVPTDLFSAAGRNDMVRRGGAAGGGGAGGGGFL